MTNTGNVVAITPLQAAPPSDQKFSSSFIRLGISVAVIKIINLEVIPQYVVISQYREVSNIYTVVIPIDQRENNNVYCLSDIDGVLELFQT